MYVSCTCVTPAPTLINSTISGKTQFRYSCSWFSLYLQVLIIFVRLLIKAKCPSHFSQFKYEFMTPLVLCMY